MKNLKLYRLPIFYIVFILAVPTLAIIGWRLVTGQTHLYVNEDDILQSLAALLLGASLWLFIFTATLKIKYLSVPEQPNNMPLIQKVILTVLAALLSYVLWSCSYRLGDFSGHLFGFLCGYLLALMLITTNHNRWFFCSAGIFSLIVPIIQLLDSPYRLRRIIDLLFKDQTHLIDSPFEENLHNSVLFGSAIKDWIDVYPYSYYDYGQRLILKLIHTIGFIPALFVAVAVLSAWVFMAMRIYRLKNVNKFWQSLAFYLSLFFIIEGLINILGNVNVLKGVMRTNLMPFSSNAGLWMFFIAFCIACWKIRNK